MLCTLFACMYLISKIKVSKQKQITITTFQTHVQSLIVSQKVIGIFHHVSDKQAFFLYQ